MALGKEDPVNYAHYTDRLKRPDVLSELKSADNKFLFTRALLIEHGMLPTTLDRPANSTVRSVIINWQAGLERGIELALNGHHKEAAKEFSQAIFQGEPGTEDHTLAVINRAEVLFRLGKFTQSLMDVRQALGSKYPPVIGHKLYRLAGNVYMTLGRREEAQQSYAECLRWLDKANITAEEEQKFRLEVAVAMDMCKYCEDAESDSSDTSDDSDLENPFPNQLVGGENKNIPALSAFLELKSSKNMGRGVYATRDINPGDVVAIDKPYIYGEWSLCDSSCRNCLKSPVVPIPCKKCSLVYYCSENCLHKSMKDGHNLECPIIFFIRSLPGITDLNQLALKWLVKELSKMGLKKYCSLVDTFSKSKIDPKTRGFNENGQYKSDNFLTAYSLDSSEEKMPIDVFFFFNCIAAEILQYLMLSGYKIDEHYLGIVGTSLVRILSVLDLNARQLNNNAPNMVHLSGIMSYYYSTFPIAIALYPSLALFNHSCDPNIERSGKFSTKTRVIKAIQPIPKGNQLYFNYGTSILFDKMKKHERQEICRDNFKFECCCQRCIENWPDYDSMPNGLSAINILNPSMADTVIKECKLFEEFIEKVSYDEFHHHLDYLYGFIKLLFANVKRPFGLYHKCLHIINHAHTELKHPIIF